MEVSSTDELVYPDYWQRFQDNDSEAADVLQPVSMCEALDHMPLRKAVKVL